MTYGPMNVKFNKYILPPRRGRKQVPPKRWYLPNYAATHHRTQSNRISSRLLNGRTDGLCPNPFIFVYLKFCFPSPFVYPFTPDLSNRYADDNLAIFTLLDINFHLSVGFYFSYLVAPYFFCQYNHVFSP